MINVRFYLLGEMRAQWQMYAPPRKGEGFANLETGIVFACVKDVTWLKWNACDVQLELE